MKICTAFKKNLYLFMTLFCLPILGCSNDSSDGGDTITPSNLAVTITKVGFSDSTPNGDGSGTISLTATAVNATLYKINFGNGQLVESTTGLVNHTFTDMGTNTYTIYVSAYNGTKFISKTIATTVYVSPELLWSDEFNVNGAPNSTYWGYDIGTGSNGWGNNEAQYYTNRPENVIVQDGILKINLIKEVYSGSNYTSARIVTKDKFSFKYGRVEIKAKLATGGGTWPALWMLGDNIGTAGWPGCGEIDIMEHVGNAQNKIYGTLHHPGHSGGNADGGNVTISNASSEFHVYAVDWTSSYIKFYVDNQLYYSFVNTNSLPFNQNFFLIFNCAMGGNFGGNIDPNFTSTTLEVDYIRVYQ
ncbi:MAG TPA: glycoside hydrolase family 16 protein [Flavobacterium sp.]|jgi:hypothetical protein|nr:glycoside hydrolase family 16 protein [Flavobacterium sp.]HQV34684.1 glycoside hydrolase family 16 protein [Flavobacterium sp.]HQX02711.1 glycoside hydrolase family 16 protein [Flavobacterium sp.]HRZ30744.1 glycoside hydrolase family 16 protein [Flavobacterium sp.]HRZ73655.1 glycoside hydrolase family 16 protein [Flavobacterium sp.]